MSPEVLVYGQTGYEIAALKKVDELTEDGMICEFSVFDTLEQSLAYATDRLIPKVFAVGKEIEVYEI